MPCYSPEPTAEELRESYYKQFEHNSEVAENLCWMMQNVRLPKALPVSLLAWWMAHQERDAKKNAREKAEADHQRARQIALAKLTPSEREMLGLDSD